MSSFQLPAHLISYVVYCKEYVCGVCVSCLVMNTAVCIIYRTWGVKTAWLRQRGVDAWERSRRWSNIWDAVQFVCVWHHSVRSQWSPSILHTKTDTWSKARHSNNDLNTIVHCKETSHMLKINVWPGHLLKNEIQQFFAKFTLSFKFKYRVFQ